MQSLKTTTTTTKLINTLNTRTLGPEGARILKMSITQGKTIVFFNYTLR